MIVRLTILAGMFGLVATDATAQNWTQPHAFHNGFSKSPNLMPFGRTKLFAQAWYAGTGMAPGTVVSQFGYRPDDGVQAPATTFRIEVKLDNTSVPFNGLSRTFGNNLSGQETTVFALGSVNLPAINAPTDPNQPMLWIPMTTPFVYGGPHLLVQFDNATALSPSTTRFAADGYSMTATDGFVTTFGNSCGGSLASQYDGMDYRLDLQGAVPRQPVTFLLGGDNRVFAGAVPLPFDLTNFGLPGCELLVDPLVDVTLLASATGTAALSLPYTPQADSLILFAQALHGTGLALKTSNATSTILGRTGYSTYLYNWTSFGPTAQFGPYSTNRCPVLLMR